MVFPNFTSVVASPLHETWRASISAKRNCMVGYDGSGHTNFSLLRPSSLVLTTTGTSCSRKGMRPGTYVNARMAQQCGQRFASRGTQAQIAIRQIIPSTEYQ